LEKFVLIFLEFFNQPLFLKEKNGENCLLFLNLQLYLPDLWLVKNFFLSFSLRSRIGISFQKTNFREKLKNSQRVKI